MFWLRNTKIKFLLRTLYLSPAFHLLFSKKVLVITAGIYKILVIIANREHPEQTASLEADKLNG